MQRLAKFIMLGVTALGLSSCAFYEKGAYQKVALVTTPSAALCRIYSEDRGFIKSIATPGSKYIPRDDAAIEIVCEKSGYKTKSVVVAPEGYNRHANGTFGNTFLTGGLGFIPDRFNSSFYDWPDRIEIALEQN